MPGEVVERAVADEHVADEQDHLGDEREGEQDRGDRPELGEHVVGAGQRPGEHQRQHALATVGADHVGGDERDEQQQRRRHADVLAVGDDLDPVGERLVAGDVADADVDDRRDRHDAEEHERGDLLAPRAAQSERPTDRRLVQRERRRAAPAARPVVGPVAAVVDRATPPPMLAELTTSRSPGSCGGELEEHVVERGQPGRQRVQRQPELGDHVAQRVELHRRRARRPRHGRRRASRARPAAASASSSSDPWTPTSTVTVPVRSSSDLGRTRHDQPAAVDHHHVVAHLLHVVEQVGGHQHRDAERAEPGDQLRASPRARAGRGRRSARRAARARDRRRAPGPAWCAGACRWRSRRSGGSGPRRDRPDRGCPTPVGGRPAPAAR